jgi:hypothetical protein
VFGTISDANRESMLQVCSIWLLKMYWEYSAGIGNIFKVFRIDFAWKLFKHTRYAAILSKRIFGFYF